MRMALAGASLLLLYAYERLFVIEKAMSLSN